MKVVVKHSKWVRIAVYSALAILTVSVMVHLLIINASADRSEQVSLERIDKGRQETIALKLKMEKIRVEEKRVAQEKARKRAAQESAERAAKNIVAIPKQTKAKQCNNSSSHNNPDSIDIIANKKHCLMPLDYAPSDMQVIYGATLRQEAAGQYKQLIDAANKAGHAIRATSSYRSYAQQVSTYNHWVSVNGSIAAADTVSARPGYSEHQIGLTVDVATNGCVLDCFAGTKAYSWMIKNAHRYGFIERYPTGKSSVTGYSPEAWHYRYVGSRVAGSMRKNAIDTLEEYWNIPGGDY